MIHKRQKVKYRESQKVKKYLQKLLTIKVFGGTISLSNERTINKFERRFKMELTREEMDVILGTFVYVNDVSGLTSDELKLKEKIEQWFEDNKITK